ncbi:DUF481 domain-containing protein [Paraflavitalea sp. CAU 1676]|uniref:DUF481 domain-containing protein n=1 Tax=Paraflavitalea sp. CAU 1676 TaxID=3032598 RepID=UPI0023DB7B86|nr:DUF481 domain-containing protein [Paraflavitalea sp. CAU 1676]MDF2191464.1 DUF481 domain-containing protein [Paraflavitalea sp. CAU 1676]
MKHTCLLVLLVLCMIGTNAQKIKDTLYFLNGSKVIGEIKRIKLGVIIFDPDDANDITVQLQKVKTLAALMKVFRIETTGHTVYFGKMIPANLPGYATIATTMDSTLYPIEQISLLYAYRSTFRQRFDGKVAGGFDYTRTSGLGRINFDGTINYVAKKTELTIASSGIYTLTDSTLSRDREDMSLKANYYFNTTWFSTAFLKYQRNLELGLKRRYQEGLGAGNKFITSKHVYAWSRVGGVVNQEVSTDDVKSGTLVELFGQFEFNFFRFTKPEISISLAESVYYSLSQSGRVRNDAQLTISWEIIKDLDLSLSAYTNFDSQPQTAESKKFDFGTVFSIGYSF